MTEGTRPGDRGRTSRVREADLGGSEGAVEDRGEEEEGTDVSSVESPGISPESVQWVQEDLELGLERASVTTAGRWDTLLESAVLPGEEGCNGQSGLYRNLENNVYNLSSLVIRINQSL